MYVCVYIYNKQVLIEEKLADNATKQGARLMDGLKSLQKKYPVVQTVRGKGLLQAAVIDNTKRPEIAWDICLEMKEHGLLAKPTHGNIIRFAPPLVITEEQVDDALTIMEASLKKFA
jgi:ornithine--oxo-acid transaminase